MTQRFGPQRFGLPSLVRRGRGAPEAEPFGDLHREMNRLFEDFARPFAGTSLASTWGGAGLLAPKIDVAETDEALTITAELPGIDENDIELTLTDGALVIKGEKKSEEETENKTYRLVERSYGAFERAVALPFEVEDGAVEARFDKGVLTVDVRKPSEAKRRDRRIEISTKTS